METIGLLALIAIDIFVATTFTLWIIACLVGA